MVENPADLSRFLTAQAPVYETVLHELRAGSKRTHWMWFVFPQLRGLGQSSTAQFFGIASLDEARGYVEHHELGTRLVACVQTLLSLKGYSLKSIFGTPDDMKFRSSMTLFAVAEGESHSIYREALERYCAGVADERTLSLLGVSTL